MIRLSGLEPGRDVEVVFSGIRPGERLHEALFAADEPIADIGISGMVAARPVNPALETMRAWLAALEQASAATIARRSTGCSATPCRGSARRRCSATTRSETEIKRGR